MFTQGNIYTYVGCESGTMYIYYGIRSGGGGGVLIKAPITVT